MTGVARMLGATVLLIGCAGAPPPPVKAPAAPPTVTAAPAAAPAPRPRPRPRPAEAPKPTASSLEEAAERVAARLKVLQERQKASSVAAQPAPEGVVDLQQRYEGLLGLPGTPEARKPEILLRLAELAYRKEEAEARASYETGGEGRGVAGGEGAVRYPASIVYYRRLVDAYPSSSQALTAFYNLGYLYAEEGKSALSAWAYEQVLERDPTTPYADEIHMRLGEAAFDGGAVAEAIPHYRAVVDRGNPEYVDKALYKLGWSFYNLDDYAKAVEAFSGVLEQERGASDDLRRETLEVMARSFLEWGGVEGVGRYLAAAGRAGSFGDRLYRTVGDQYAEASRYEDAARAYAAGIRAYPLSAECLDMEKGLLGALLIRRDLEGANDRRESWLGRYGAGTPWDAANGAGPLGAARDRLVEEGLRLAALYRHSQAQRGQGSLSKAIELYERYLALFGGDSEEGYELSYSHAQALKEADRLADAQARYQAVATHPTRSAHREEASYRRIEVLQTLFDRDPATLGPLLEAHEQYAALNPSSPLVPQILFAEGELCLTAERFADARAVFGRVVREHGGSPFALEALERIARCHFREGSFGEAEAAARRALAARPSPEVAERADKLLTFSVFKQGEEAEGAGDRDAANRHFFRLADEFPASEVAQVALNRAAENLRALNRPAEAAEVYGRLAHTYRGSAYARNALEVSAQLLSSLGDWRQAARNYEDLYRTDPRAEGAADALYRAGLAAEKGGDLATAARLFGEFSSRLPGDLRRGEALFREGTALRTLERPAEARERFAAAWEAPAEGDRATYRAQAALALGDLTLEGFRGVELKGDLEQSLGRKEALLDEALGYLARAASLPFAETLTASLYRAGRAFEDMKESLLGSERPPELTAEEREQYDFLLEEKAAPLEETSVSYYRKGIASAVASGVHTEWVDRMFERLEALLPWAYQRAEEPAAAWVLPAPPRPGEGVQ
ncbi:MAG: tetratricopeptide repeat protein [Deltaproteobacteria bacterium]|nr:tetratricopeptide repeat protein [Deltaproteobacteria bacterium]